MTVKALIPVRTVNLVAPLAHKATDMHKRDTAATVQARSSATAPMVRALLDGTKTQTRRAMKQQPKNGWAPELPPVLGRITSPHSKRGKFGVFLRRGLGTDFPEADLVPCPYGQPGDQLWVREAWCGEVDADTSQLIYNEDGNTYKCLYRADGHHVALDDGDGFSKTNKDGSEASPWKSPIHMPRWASRITLEITGVRVERLQEISEADAKAEGAHTVFTGDDAYRRGYGQIWESINGPGSWDLNPWVWVVEFRRIEAC